MFATSSATIAEQGRELNPPLDELLNSAEAARNP